MRDNIDTDCDIAENRRWAPAGTGWQAPPAPASLKLSWPTPWDRSTGLKNVTMVWITYLQNNLDLRNES